MPAPFSIDELITPLTSAQVKTKIYAALAAVGVRTSSWKPGAVVKTQIAASSIILGALSQIQSDIARSGFLEYSSGSWLTLVAYYVYGVKRLSASFAAGTIKLVNTGGGVYSLGPDDLIFVNPTTGKSYRNSGSITLGAMATITVPIVATESGTESTTSPNTITQLQTTLAGVTCTNEAALVGLDAEKDPALRERCYEQLGALSPFGPWDAYGSALRNAKRADGTPLGIVRTRLNKDGKGRIDVYCATATGALGGPDVVIADEAVQQWAAPLAVNAITQSASAVPITIAYELWMYNTSGNTPDQVEALVATTLGNFMATQPLGGNVIGGGAGKVFQDAIRSAIQATLSQIFHVVVTAPAGDTTLAINEVPTLNGTPTAIVHQQAPPEGFSP